MKQFYVTNKLSDTVYGIVEDDPFRENPIMYVVFGADRAALIDTGCATGDLLEYLRGDTSQDDGDRFVRHCTPHQAELVRNRLIVINTHNHYDHVASNYRFCHPERGLTNGVQDLCASSADRAYTREHFSTLSWYSGCRVRPYAITQWLDDGEKIQLSENKNGGDADGSTLEVIHSPGHTPDSLCLYYPKDRRLFVGDVIYRWAFVMAVGVKACPHAFERSTSKLVDFIRAKERQLGHPITLSCGHNDDNLDSSYMTRLNELFHRINTGNLRSTSSWRSLFAEYNESGSDASLSVTIRKWRRFDCVLKPILKLFFRR